MRENIPIKQEITKQEGLFRKRFFETVAENVSKIKEAEKTEVSLIDKISEEERQAVFEFEKGLYEKLKALEKGGPRIRSFRPTLLKNFEKLSSKAKDALKFVTGLEEGEILTHPGFTQKDLVGQRR
ncbi:MAG TPA: hypothetical protein GX706_03080 [Candidatus Moranbacteria bacterium]|nr:hypothetical protein [Candidatus Moranbacteria bacterium]